MGGVTLDMFMYIGRVGSQVVEFLQLSMATIFVHCGANVLIASWAMHLSMYHAGFSVFLLQWDHVDTYPASTIANVSCSEGTVVLTQVQGLSECCANFRTITYERSGGVVTHDCAPVA